MRCGADWPAAVRPGASDGVSTDRTQRRMLWAARSGQHGAKQAGRVTEQLKFGEGERQACMKNERGCG